MPSNTLPIVGMFYRPPAKAIIEVLAVGTPLTLMAEPENQYDPNAIAVWLSSADIPTTSYSALEAALGPYGFSLDQILAEDQWHLGYIPKEMAKTLNAAQAIDPSEPMEVTFSTSSGGAPRVRRTEPFPI